MSGLSVASSKVYDGTTSAVVLGTAVLQAHETFAPGTSGDGKPYIGDTVSITGTAIGTYNNKDVGAGTTVTFSGLSLTGGQAGNYTLTLQSPASATITTKALTMSGLSVPASKIYDGTLAAVVNGTAALHSAEATGGAATTSDGKPYIGDTVSLTGTALGTYNSKNVGIATTVTFSGLSLAGGQAGDYSLTIQSPASATIAARPASVTAVDNSKTVGTSDPPLATTNSGFIAGELGVGKITFSATRAAGETVGTYPITPSADDAGSGMLGNYNVALNHGTFTITNELIPTVTVNCGTNTVNLGSSLSCTVSVVRPSGSGTPTGTVAWTTDGAGGFGATTPCTLSSSVSGTASCSATYTPTGVGTGTHMLIATYNGDAVFATNYGSRNVKVTMLYITYLPIILR